MFFFNCIVLRIYFSSSIPAKVFLQSLPPNFIHQDFASVSPMMTPMNTGFRLFYRYCPPIFTMARRFQTSVSTDLTPSQFLMLSSLSMDALQWPHRFVDNNKIEYDKFLGSNVQKVIVSIEGGEVNILSKYKDWVITDYGKNKKTANELLQAIEITKPLYTGEELDERLNIIRAEAEAAAKDLEERLQKGELTASEKIALGVGGHKVTYGLMVANILIFVVMAAFGVGLFEPAPADLLKWGANFRLYTESGDWWRLVTCTFIHIGIIHLLLNMYALFSIGIYLEPVLGRWKLLTVYLTTGIFASLTSIWWHGDTISAGASGAIFGLYGVFLALLTTRYFEKDLQGPMLTSIMVFVGYNLIYGMKAGIDNSAHAGGLLSGLAFGYLFYGSQNSPLKKYFTIICIVVGVGVSTAFLSFRENDEGAFYKIIDQVSALEEKGLEPFKNLSSLSKEAFIKQANEVSLPAWNKADALLKTTGNFKLTAESTKRRELLLQYMQLRIESVKKAIDAENSGDWTEADILFNRISRLIQDIQTLDKSK
jgi:rhomboid protease GluP